MNKTKTTLLSQQVIQDATEWMMMHGVAFKQADHSAKHCPFSIAPMTLQRDVYEHLLKVTPLLSKLISNVSEDHEFLQTNMRDMAKADPFFGRLMSLHETLHSTHSDRPLPVRQPLLLMRSDFMDDRHHGAKVIEFNGIAAGMGPFGQRATEFHAFMHNQWPTIYRDNVEERNAVAVPNRALTQLAYAMATAAKKVKIATNESGKPAFLMVVQPDEDNVYDQHLLEIELQRLGVRTVRRTFTQLSGQLATGEHQRLLLQDVGSIDLVYLRAGYQYSDYFAPELEESVCCHTLSQTRLFIEQHRVAMNATLSQQIATSKSMQMLLTIMPAQDYARWGLNLEEAQWVKSVLAEMKPINAENINWFNSTANKQDWVLKNQGEGGGHCLFGDAISAKLSALAPEEYDAWALMQRLYPHTRNSPVIAVRDAQQTVIHDLVSEIGLFSAYFNGAPVTQYNGYAGYLIRSKPASENEGGIHSGQGILDSLTLID